MDLHTSCPTFQEFIDLCKAHTCENKELIPEDMPLTLRYGAVCSGCRDTWSVRANQIFEYAKTLPGNGGETLKFMMSSEYGKKIFITSVLGGKDRKTVEQEIEEATKELENLPPEYDCTKEMEEGLVVAHSLQNMINQLITIGKDVTVLPADDLERGWKGFVVFTTDDKGKERAFLPSIPFRPKVGETIECKSRKEFDDYRATALEKKWIVRILDKPRELTRGFTVQNSDGVTLYTIRLGAWQTKG